MRIPIFYDFEAREILRLDGNENDEILNALIDAIPAYLHETTGYTPRKGRFSPLAKTAARFILQQWYFGESADSDKLQRVIDNLLKALANERALPK
jgi:hypothetical protein